jgi:hypothetical protein
MSTPKKNPVALALSSIEVKLDMLEVPKNYYNRGRRWVLQGSKHDFMPKVLAMIRKSPTASALFNRKTSLVAGDGFKLDALAQPALAAFLPQVARSGKHRTGNLLLRRVAKDYARLRGYAIQVIWTHDGLHISELHHQRFETVACGPMNDEGEVENYWLCRDWSHQGLYPPRQIPAYDPSRAAVEPVQLYYYSEEEPGVEYYPALDYESALPYIEMEADLAAFHGTNVATNFAAQTIIAINKGPEDTQGEDGTIITAKQQRDRNEDAFKQKYTGPKAQRFMFIYGDGTADAADKMAKITTVGAGNSELYTTYAALAQQAILSAGSCTSPMVAGLPSANGGALGGNANELYQAFKLYFNAACEPDQESLLEGFRELFGHVAGVSFEGENEETPSLSIKGSLPVEFTFSEALMELIMTDDELRAQINLKPLPAGEAPAVTKSAKGATETEIASPPAPPQLPG